jgi:hypothetical protein
MNCPISLNIFRRRSPCICSKRWSRVFCAMPSIVRFPGVPRSAFRNPLTTFADRRRAAR